MSENKALSLLSPYVELFNFKHQNPLRNCGWQLNKNPKLDKVVHYSEFNCL